MDIGSGPFFIGHQTPDPPYIPQNSVFILAFIQ